LIPAFDPGATLAETLHPIPRGPLADFLRAHVEPFQGEIAVEQFQGGQSNPTYKVTASADESRRRYVLRRKPPGHLLPSAHAVEREYRILSALAGSQVPVPRTYALCEDASVIGTAFFVMEYVDGRILWDPTLPGMTRDERAAHYAELNRVIAALHCFDYAGRGPLGLRTSRQLRRAADRTLDEAVPGRCRGPDSRDGPADRMASRITCRRATRRASCTATTGSTT
jgi:aminoglycoside phosphotransferase (APT) family kinase protein